MHDAFLELHADKVMSTNRRFDAHPPQSNMRMLLPQPCYNANSSPGDQIIQNSTFSNWQVSSLGSMPAVLPFRTPNDVNQGFQQISFQHASHQLPGLSTVPLGSGLGSPSLIQIAGGNDICTESNQGQAHWKSTIETNKKLIEAWQTQMLAQCSGSEHTSSSSTIGSLSPCQPFGFDQKSKSGSSTCDSDSNSSSGLISTSRKRKSASATTESTDPSFEMSVDNSDTTSSSSQSQKTTKSSSEWSKSERKNRKKKKSKKSKKEQKIDLFPRKKKEEEHRSRDHMIISLGRLKLLFHLPLKKAATQLGICGTALKSVCRKIGLERWPYTRVRKPAGGDKETAALQSQGQ